MNEQLPWRELLARWPDAWRERWGQRANQLEEQGLHWIEAERQAMNETMAVKATAATTTVAVVERTGTLFREVA